MNTFRIPLRALTVLLCVSCWVSSIVAQEDESLRREVEVVKPYSPEVSDFSKINALPDLTDTLKVNTRFEHNIRSSIASAQFNPVLLSPLSLQPPMPLSPYKGYLKAGFGSYLSPMAEGYYHLGEKGVYGLDLHALHRSSMGDLEMPDGKEVEAPFSSTDLGASAVRYLKGGNLSADLNLQYATWNFYGYNPLTPNEEALSQRILLPHLGLAYQSSARKTFRFHLGAAVDYLRDHDEKTETEISVAAGLKALWSRTEVGVSADMRWISGEELLTASPLFGYQKTGRAAYARTTPYISLNHSQFQLLAGIGLDYEKQEDEEGAFRVFPEVKATWKIVPGESELFASLTGGVVPNTYRALIRFNPYVIPGWATRSSVEQIRVQAGVRGNPGQSRWHYQIKASLGIWEDQIFWIHSGSRGDFLIPVPDDARVMDLSGELLYRHSDRFSTVLQAGYHYWVTDLLPEAWHKTPWDATWSWRYRAGEKFYADFEVFFSGSRKFSPDYYRVLEGTLAAEDFQELETDALADLNLKLEYRFTPVFSVFAQGKNLLNRQYALWGFYPVQGMQIMGGLTVSF